MTTLIAYPHPGQVSETLEPTRARESVGIDEPLGSLVPRPRPLLFGGCSDIAATIRHRRLVRRRAARLSPAV